MSTSSNKQRQSADLTVTQVLLARITALEAENQLLQHQVNTDELTGLYNRRGFHRTLAQEWRRCTRRKEPLSLILTGVDHFKFYNESKGRAGGDMLLRHLARDFMDISKRAGDSLARCGGDEFVCILPDTGLEGASGLAEKMRIHSNLLGISISVGVASQVPQQDEDPSVLVEAVETALIKAKQQGRNRVAVAASSCPSN
ncbi:MAG: GGDEF domain-containing protein [Elainellaceae cyanobacterium]